MLRSGWPRRRAVGRPWMLAYAPAVIAAELAYGFVQPELGAAVHAATLAIVVAHIVFSRGATRQLAPIALLPLTRLVSIVVPVAEVGPGLDLVMVGTPLLLATVLIARRVDPRALADGLGWTSSAWWQPLVALLGLPAGLLMTRAGLAGPVALQDNPLFYVGAMLLFVALFEELLYRGLLLRAASRHALPMALALPNVLYAAMYSGTGSPVAMAAMGSIGFAFSLVAWRTGSLWGVVLAHMLARVVVGIG